MWIVEVFELMICSINYYFLRKNVIQVPRYDKYVPPHVQGSSSNQPIHFNLSFMNHKSYWFEFELQCSQNLFMNWLSMRCHFSPLLSRRIRIQSLLFCSFLIFFCCFTAWKIWTDNTWYCLMSHFSFNVFHRIIEGHTK